MTLTPNDLQFFSGAASEASAQVYVRAPAIATQAGHSLAGRIHGPFCKYATTLPASFAISDQGAGPCVLAKGMVSDPCCWTPELPFLYRVDLEWRTPSGNVSLGSRHIALRRMGARGTSWYLEGQRWVIRGVACELAGNVPLELWHEACPVCIEVGLPEDSVIEEAAKEGVMLIPSLRGEQISELDRLARQTTIAACILESSPEWPADLRRRIPQTIFWQSLPVDAPRELAPWAQGVIVTIGEDPEAIAAWSDFPAPVVVRRIIGAAPSLNAARAECDRLQRDVAPYGDWAGFVVS